MDADRLTPSLEQVVVGAVGLTTRALAEAAPGVELTFPQWRALLIVGEHDDGARVGEVASRVAVTLPATSRLLRRLERRDLVVLATDDTDHRATRARLTPAGLRVRSAILEFRHAALESIATRLAGTGATGVEAALGTLADEFGRFG